MIGYGFEVGSSAADDQDRLFNNDSTDDVFYEWDALGCYLSHDDEATDTMFVQSGQQEIVVYTAGSAATSPTYTYVYSSYIVEPVENDLTGGLRHYHRNQQYSINALTDSSGVIKKRYAYDAYGGLSIFDSADSVRTSTAEGNRYTYTGREYDDITDAYHYRARIYLSQIGRFGSRDPIGFANGSHLYCGYFAPRNVDPSGTSSRASSSFNPAGQHGGTICAIPLMNHGGQPDSIWIEEAERAGHHVDRTGASSPLSPQHSVGI